MKIELLLFARLREAAGTERAAVNAANDATVAQVASDFFTQRGVEPSSLPPIRFAVNEVFVPDDHVPRDGDRVALLAPFAGG